MSQVFCFDPTVKDKPSAARGVGRYLQILRENFGDDWVFSNNLRAMNHEPRTIFINPFFNIISPPFLTHRVAKKQIAVIHDLIPLKYPPHFPLGLRGNLNVLLNKFFLKNYDLIITDSEASKKDIVRMLYISDKKIKVIYPIAPKLFQISQVVISNPVKRVEKSLRDSSVASLFRNDMNAKFCIYVGDATWNKNLVSLARAIKLANVNCVFVGKVFKHVVGDGKAQIPILSNRLGPLWGEAAKNTVSSFSHIWQKELKEFRELSKDDNRFIFPGFIPDEELIKLYKRSMCNILLSRDEGFGFSYLEAAILGIPSILSDIPIFHEISGGNGAVFCDQNDVQAVAKAINKIYVNSNLKNKLAVEALQRSKYFSSELFKKAWDEEVTNL